MPTINCPHCGFTNRSGSKFCNECGTDLRGVTEPPIEPRIDSWADEFEPEDLAAEGPEHPLLALTSGGRTRDDEHRDRSPRDSEGGREAEQEREPWADDAPPARPSRPPRLNMRRPTQANQPAQPPPPDQPWLRPEADDADAATPPQPGPERESRLFSGLQGLLDPMEMTAQIPPFAAAGPQIGSPTLNEASRRQLRTLAGSGLNLADPLPPPPRPQPLTQRPPSLIALLIGLALGLPVLLLAASQDIRPHLWPGVKVAVKSVDKLDPGSVVLVNWAYDPATAAEMDMVAEPVIYHLLAQRSQLVVVSQLPAGPATARRVVAQAAQELRTREGIFLPLSGAQSAVVDGGYLPGGTGVLPLLGQDPAQTVRAALAPAAQGALLPRAITRLDTQGAPDLSVIFAAQAEDVQEWLEQVQPLDGVPVLAVVSAGADPILRPYLDSGQLAGLVSGFDGAFNYANSIPNGPSPLADERMQVQAVAQDWGLWVILGIILAGNLRGLFGRRASAGERGA